MITAENKEILYKEYHDKVFSYISARVPNTEDAEDLCAEVFEKVLRSEMNYNAALSSHGTWLYTITRNTVIDYFRKLRPIQALPEDMEEELSPEDIVIRESLLEELAAALEKLPTDQLDMIVLHYYDGLPLTQIAVQLDVSYSVVKHKHRKALATLKSKLK